MKQLLSILTAGLLIFSVGCKSLKDKDAGGKAEFINQTVMEQTIKNILEKQTDANKDLVERGVKQTAALWQKEDGTSEAFTRFCEENYVSNPDKRLQLFQKLQNAFEALWGNYNKMSMELREPVDMDGGEVTAIDEMFAAYAPSSHLTDDLFANKIAFLTVLNFPAYSLTEKTEMSPNWDRNQWAYARMGDVFITRIPAQLTQNISEAYTKGDMYISEYNIMMGELVDAQGKTYFSKDMKLISHWNLRDELKSHYGQADGLPKQEMVYAVMKRIIDQSIPEKVINNPEYQWNPLDNKLFKNGKEETFSPEPDTRYQTLLNNFSAMKAVDSYYPLYPTYIKRAFELNMEIPEDDVKALFEKLLSAPQMKQIGEIISKRLGRPLRPFDIWYDGFKSRSSLNQDDLTAKISKMYPNAAAFEKDMPTMLTSLGWTPERAAYIASKIRVDAARGSGHAAGAAMKGDKARLRTRIPETGMNYKGYNIAVHEFGHNVEQTISLYDMDNYLMNGVPNTAFTEALAFLFQDRDLAILNKTGKNAGNDAENALDLTWSAYEIMGVAMVDVSVWHWMYENPNAKPEELKEAVIRIAKEIWNKYYAPVFGMENEPILAIYSHMIDNPLYLSNYPMGHLIEFQLDEYMKGKPFSTEVDRIYKQGRMIPQMWMKAAVGAELSVDPLLHAAEKALSEINK